MDFLVTLNRERIERLSMLAVLDPARGRRYVSIAISESGDDGRLQLAIPLAALGDLIERLRDAQELAAGATVPQFAGCSELVRHGGTEQELAASAESLRSTREGRA
jgi:hypothetical protein